MPNGNLLKIREDFLSLDDSNKLQLLLEFSDTLPELPENLKNNPELTERVIECQSPLHIAVRVDKKSRVYIFATAPKEAPTTRGFASILIHGLNGKTVDEVLAVPGDYPQSLASKN